MKRSIKSNQRGMRMLFFKVDGTGTAALSGPDQHSATLTDNGTGDYTVTFVNDRIFTGVPLVFATPLTDDVHISQHSASTGSAVRLECRSRAVAEAAASLTVDSALKFHSQLPAVDGNDISVEFTAIANVDATATLAVTAPITLTDVAGGSARNTETLTIQVAAAAANPTDTILAVFSGTAAAMTLTITPNDGTNNGATPVAMTTAELVEYINTGDIAAKTGQVTLTDASGWLNNQTASGGDATALADSGEGDGVAATFSGGVDATVAGSESIASVSDAGAIVINIEDGVSTATQVHAAIMADSVLAHEVRNFIASEVLVGATAINHAAAANLSGGVAAVAAAAVDCDFDLMVVGSDVSDTY